MEKSGRRERWRRVVEGSGVGEWWRIVVEVNDRGSGGMEAGLEESGGNDEESKNERERPGRWLGGENIGIHHGCIVWLTRWKEENVRGEIKAKRG